MSDTYAAVDSSSNIAEAIAWQERIDRWPAIATYKDRMDLAIGDSAPVLDVGAGPGLDAIRTGALALDRSSAMAARARSRGVSTMVGDAHDLPIGDDMLGAVRADRVLQHLDRPLAAVAEMYRVLQPGGRLVVADPDQQTLSITVPGVPAAITDRVRRLRQEVGYRNGHLASEMAGHLARLGMVDVRCEGSALVLTEPESAFGLPGWVEYWQEEGGFTPADNELWREKLIESTNAGFVYAVTYLVTTATKPGRFKGTSSDLR